MHIVLEGPDNAGKSVLARYIASRIGRTIVPSEGPEKYPGEINERIDRYFGFKDVVFDRHPCVSETIYGRLRGRGNVDPFLLLRFYEERPLFIYCRGRDLDGHVVKAHDTAEHLATVKSNHDRLCRLYDAWALDKAHIVYRVGDSMENIVTLVRSLI